jgi:hypothetical protein
MSPRRIRFEARLFRGESVAFEACSDFRPTDDAELCRCGWLAPDHTSAMPTAVRPLRRSAPAARVPARRAS